VSLLTPSNICEGSLLPIITHERRKIDINEIDVEITSRIAQAITLCFLGRYLALKRILENFFLHGGRRL